MEAQNINTKNNFSKILRNIPEHEYVEYVYLEDKEVSKNIFKNLEETDTYLLTLNSNNELYIIDNRPETNIIDYNENTITSRPELDLIIISEATNIPNKYIQDMVTQNTIITKIFDNNITYIEDTMSDKKILIIDNDTYTIIGSGIETKIYKNMEEKNN